MRVKKDDNSRVMNKEVLITNYAPANHLPHGEIETNQMALDLGRAIKEHRLTYKIKS
jgi:hypothetical protein